MKIELIVAKSSNNVIGKNNELIWDIPEDRTHFKNVTMGKTIVMGRNTYESIGRPLPGRKNVIITSDPSKINDERLSFVSSVEEVLELAKVEEVVIIGGDSVYKQFLPYCDILHVTEIDKDFEGDTFFPVIDENTWSLKLSVDGKESGKNGICYSFNIYEKSFKK